MDELPVTVSAQHETQTVLRRWGKDMSMELIAEAPAVQSLDIKTNILLVDDRAENLMALESVLSELGQNIVTARSGREALKSVLQQDFAVILLDVQMPDMNGFETATLIRAREKSQHTPIIFLTAINKSESHVSIGYSVGAIDYVFKPFEPEILKAKVSAFVELSRKTKELEAEVERRKQAEEEVRNLNEDLEARVRRRTAELERANKKLHREIGERKRAEEAITANKEHIESLNKRLQQAMTETHHRVKNNLQIIAAMVDMRLMDKPTSIRPEEMYRLGAHVRTLAAVHDILTAEAKEDGEAHYLSALEVLERLLSMLQDTIPDRRLKIKIEDARLTARQGTSLALIVNELISNALKYGKGMIDVDFTVVLKDAILSVCDDGPGFPEGFDAVKSASTGLELVNNLSRWDLGGDCVFENRKSGGACVTIKIPLPQAADEQGAAVNGAHPPQEFGKR
jgi:two-component system sensor histidine kinase/response regulator